MSFTHLKAKDYKGIKEIYLSNLSHINVICGKNSSGKSSILEALTAEDKYGVGDYIDYQKIYDKSIAPIFAGYGSPIPGLSRKWFQSFIDNFKIKSKFIYNSELHEFAQTIQAHFKKDAEINSYSWNINFEEVLRSYFQNIPLNYRPILIPPKRKLESITKIKLDEELSPDGKGCINKLFYLKNQDQESSDYRIYKQIYETFKQITKIKFNVIPSADHTLKLLFQVGDNWLSANDCGLGLRDLLIITTYVFATDYNVYLIEEPESHLHADFQKKLLFHLLKPATSKQFILSTHSPIFLDANSADKIYYCWFDKEVKVSDETTLSKIANSLGHPVTESLTSDALIFVEGPTDIAIYQKLLEWTEISDKYIIKMWPLGGDIMSSLDLTLFGNIKNVFTIIDDDPKSREARKPFVQKCKENNIPLYILERYSLENYFSLEAIRKVFPNQIDDTVSKITNGVPVDTQIGFKAKSKTIKSRNFEIIENMTLKDFEGTDLLKYIREIGEKIEASASIK